jgi:16S rRNA (guanine966-N2)-methyltransferase
MSSTRGKETRQLRIIAGAWRGRRWRFPAVADLRPTPDRVRETLFNWVMNDIVSARCLDLFAGSGALGLEALSRGAAAVVFVESSAEAAQCIQNQLASWPLDDARQHSQVHRGDALKYLQGRPADSRTYDLVFLDPPFQGEQLVKAASYLESYGWLTPQARIYIEHAADREVILPPNWQRLKSGRAGEVGYHLYSKSG